MNQLNLKLYPKETILKTSEWISSVEAPDPALKDCAIGCFKLVEDISTILKEKDISIARLQNMVFGQKTEKSQTLFDEPEVESEQEQEEAPESNTECSKNKPSSKPSSDETKAATKDSTTGKTDKLESTGKKGTRTGRRGLKAFANLKRSCKVDSCEAGKPCPQCKAAKLYASRSREITMIRSLALFVTEVIELENLRCSEAGCEFSTQAVCPEDVQNRYGNYHFSAIAQCAIFRYMSGVPSHTLEWLSECHGLRIPETTQFRLFEFAAFSLLPVYNQLLQEAADAKISFRDDSPNKILGGSRGGPEGRKAITTTIIHAITNDCQNISLYFTGSHHAGEHLGELLAQRNVDSKMIAVADGLSANRSHNHGDKVFEGGCNMHARRYFYELKDAHTSDVKVVLRIYRQTYAYEKIFKNFPAKERLAEHQKYTKPLFDELKARAERKTQELMPVSGLFKAYQYLLNHWDRLTLFLKEEGAPIDNGASERDLKKSIKHRKNSLFYKTQHGAKVGDLLMSLLFTAKANGLNPSQWLEKALTGRDELYSNPSKFIPFSRP